MAAGPTTIAVAVLILASSNISYEHVLPNLQRNSNADQMLIVLHKDEIKVKQLKNVEFNMHIKMDFKKEQHDDNSMLNVNSNSNEETSQNNAQNQVSIDCFNMKLNILRNDVHKSNIYLHLDTIEGNGDNLKLNAIPKSNKEILITNAKKLIIDHLNQDSSSTLPRDSVERIKDIFNVDSDAKVINADSPKLVADDSKTLKTNDDNTLERVRRDSEDDDIVIWDYCEGKKHLEYTDGKFKCVEVTFESRNNFGTLVNCPSDTRRVILNSIVVQCKPKRGRH